MIFFKAAKGGGPDVNKVGKNVIIRLIETILMVRDKTMEIKLLKTVKTEEILNDIRNTRNQSLG